VSGSTTAELPVASARDTAGPGLPRLLAGPPASPDPRQALADHLRTHGRLPPAAEPVALTREIAGSGLTGRGGAAFPSARKIAAVRSAPGDAVVVGNGAEGEPASRKDAALLWHAPHLVLDGLELAAAACGAGTALLCIHGGQPGLRLQLEAAISARRAAGADQVAVRLVETPPRFLAGEESALVSYLNGGAGMPAYKEYRVFERGVGGRPTLVQNVETLAHIALIARHGAAWFRAAGPADEPGSLLCTVTQADGSTQVVEAAAGTPLRRLLRLDNGVQAVLAGGYHGGWLSAGQAGALRLSNADLKPAGAFIGAGVLAALPTGCCGLAETARVVRYLALESAGQCGPCLNGLPRIAAAMAALARPRPGQRSASQHGPADADPGDLRRWAGLVTGRGACHHPDGTTRFVASALRVFAAEIDEHSAGRCTASATAPFLPAPAGATDESDWR
jgi:NADH:ubiquinone oxidoreductase subunit F (NADH-binding)